MYSINFINEVFEKNPKFTGTPITKIPQISDCQKSTQVEWNSVNTSSATWLISVFGG